MYIKHIETQKIRYDRYVKFTRQGNIFEIMAYDHKSSGNDIIKLDSDHYYDFSTPLFNPDGEAINNSLVDSLPSSAMFYTAENGYTYEKKKYIHTVNRSQSPNELRKTFKRIRAIINTNVTDVKRCKFITLTYSENMTDPELLKKDLESFNKRFKRYIKSLTYPDGRNKGLDYEYISVCEPQGRGAWHAHIIFIFNKQIQFISNAEVQRIWQAGKSETKRGFTTTRKIDNVDNVGAYLTAYLADMELPDNNIINQEQLKFSSQAPDIKVVKIKECDDSGKFVSKKKKIIKGGRLHLYPPKFHIYRCSRGIKKPETEYVKYGDALREIGASASLTYAHSVELNDDNYKNKLTYEFYNRRRRVCRKDARTSEQKIIDCVMQYNNDFHMNEKITDSYLQANYNTAEILLSLADYENKYKGQSNYV